MKKEYFLRYELTESQKKEYREYYSDGKLFQKNQKILFTININDSSRTTEQAHGYYSNEKVKI